MSSVHEKIENLAKFAGSLKKEHQIQLGFALASKNAIFFQNYAFEMGMIEKVDFYSNLMKQLWDEYQTGFISHDRLGELERLIPESGTSSSYVYAQNAIICAMYLSELVKNYSYPNLHGIIAKHFENIDYLSQEYIENTGKLVTEENILNSQTFMDSYNEVLSIIENNTVINKEYIYKNLK